MDDDTSSRRLGLTRALTGCLRDERDPSRVVHGLDELVQQPISVGRRAAWECLSESS